MIRRVESEVENIRRKRRRRARKTRKIRKRRKIGRSTIQVRVKAKVRVLNAINRKESRQANDNTQKKQS
jgi:hypothetical protein